MVIELLGLGLSSDLELMRWWRGGNMWYAYRCRMPRVGGLLSLMATIVCAVCYWDDISSCVSAGYELQIHNRRYLRFFYTTMLVVVTHLLKERTRTSRLPRYAVQYSVAREICRVCKGPFEYEENIRSNQRREPIRSSLTWCQSPSCACYKHSLVL